MKQVLVLSGKGGTGKTTVASGLIHLLEVKAYADCDVDAPNLHLVRKFEKEPVIRDYYALPKAKIDQNTCIACGRCMEVCKFQAIRCRIETERSVYEVSGFSCEGCAVCTLVCPVSAISLEVNKAGILAKYQDESSVFSTAELKMGSGTSGLLVSDVKKQMKNAVDEFQEEPTLAIIDGSPGIGCPVIASISGVDHVLLVAEPSLSGMSDLIRVMDTVDKFGVSMGACVNKYDTNEILTRQIEELCEVKGIPVYGRIPYDPEAQKAINAGISITEVECKAGRALQMICARLQQTMNRKEE